MIGLGIGVDASVLMVNRFREELVVNIVDIAGKAVFYPGLTTCIDLLSWLSLLTE